MARSAVGQALPFDHSAIMVTVQIVSALRGQLTMFLKKKLPGKDFADALVGKVGRDVYENWSDISSQIQEATGPYKMQFSEASAPLFITASVFADLQAARVAKGETEYRSLQAQVLARLSKAVDDPDTVAQLFEVFEQEWETAITQAENPVTFGIVPVLYQILGLPKSNGAIPHTQLLVLLSEVVTMPLGFTKFALEHYRIKE